MQLGLFVGERLPGNRLCGQFRSHEGERSSADEHIRPGSQDLGCGRLCHPSSGISRFHLPGEGFLTNSCQSSLRSGAASTRASYEKRFCFVANHAEHLHHQPQGSLCQEKCVCVLAQEGELCRLKERIAAITTCRLPYCFVKQTTPS